MSRSVLLILCLAFVGLVIAVLLLQSAPQETRDDVKKVAQPEAQTTSDPTVKPDAAPSKAVATPPEPAKYVPPTVHDPKLAAFVNRESTEERVTGDIHVRLPKLDHPDDVKAVAGVLLDTKDDDTVRHEAANLLRRSNYAGLTEDLLKVLHNPEERERFRAFVVQHLWSQAEKAGGDERARVLNELRACLEDRHTAVRREALLALVRLNDPSGAETALKWFTDGKPESEGVQDLCIRVVRERDLREYLPAIRKLIGGPNEDASRQAMVTVGQWGDQESRPLLEEAAKSTRPLVKRAADAALKKLDAAQAAAPATPTPDRAQEQAEPEPKPKF